MRVVESMTSWAGAYYRVRIWGKEGVPTDTFVEALEALDDKSFNSEVTPLVADYVACLDALEGISAYEVTDFEGQGVCIYPEWP